MEQIYQRIEINLTVIQTLNLIEGFKKIRRKYLDWFRKEQLRHKSMQQNAVGAKQRKKVKGMIGFDRTVVAGRKEESRDVKEDELGIDMEDISAISDRDTSKCSQSRLNEGNSPLPVHFKYISGLESGNTHRIIRKILKQECDLERSLQGSSFLALSVAHSKNSSDLKKPREPRKERSVFKSTRTKSRDYNLLKSSV